MKYYCPECRSTNHWADQKCDGSPKDAAPGNVQNPLPEAARPPVAASKRGRPRVYSDFKAHRKQYMKDWRAKQK